jgi:hypothetical protein
VTQDEEPVEEIVFSGQHRANSALRRMMVRHAGRGTEENASDARKFEAKIYVLIDRAPVQKTI